MHASPEPLRNPAVDSVACIISAGTTVTLPYISLQSHLDTISLYEPVCVNKFAPADCFECRFTLTISLSVNVYMYRMAYGGSVGTLTHIWKMNLFLSDHEERNAHGLLLVTENLPMYATRDMERTFIDKYNDVAKCSAMVLRHIYRELSQDSSAASSLKQADLDIGVAQFLLSADDTDLVLDLRTLNGRPGSTKCDAFWTECHKYLDEHVAAVSERRHGADYLYLPFAISTEDLQQEVKACLPDDTPIPSAEWLRLQYWPSDPYTTRAIHHTGRFNIKFRVQSGLVRSEHPDCKYAAMLYKYLKHFAVKFRENCLMICLDDKATVPVGEPGKPQATGVRGHNHSLVPVDDPLLSAMDHDLAGVIPSVAFILDIPCDPADSFFNGRVFVTCKDKMFDQSSPFRHGAEVCRILENHLCADGILKEKFCFSILMVGPIIRSCTVLFRCPSYVSSSDLTWMC